MKNGRLIELLVAELEMAIDADVRLTTPDFVMGSSTGVRREIDISLRRSVGSAEVLVMIECRDHKKLQGIRWIEELISKRADVGASVVVAVSRSGFTSSARRLAASHGIELRTIETIEPEDVHRWLGMSAHVTEFAPEFLRVSGRFTDGHECSEDDPVAAALLHRDHFEPVLWIPDVAAWISLADLWEHCLPQILQVSGDAWPPAGNVSPFGITIDAPEGHPIELAVGNGRIARLQMLSISGQMRWDVRPMPAVVAAEYADEDGVLSRMAMYCLRSEEGFQTVTIKAAPQEGRHLAPAARKDGRTA